MGTDFELDGRQGRIAVRRWVGDDARYVALIAHGYGEHAGRYEHVAQRLAAHGAAVYAPDHAGHGHSEGERALVRDMDALVDDLHAVAERATGEHAGLPLVLLGHSMGGIITTRYAQRHQGEPAALVLSGPVIGGNPDIEGLLDLDPIPDVPIDPAVLSRDASVGEAYAQDELVWHGPFKRPTLEAFVAAVRAIAEGGGLGPLPTLWIHGEEDELAPLAQARQAIARIRGEDLEEHVYPGARHEVLNETNREEVLDDVVAFVDRALAGRA